MSEFSDVLSNSYGDPRMRLVDRAVAPYEAEVMRQWRAQYAAPEVASLSPAAGSLESIPAQPVAPAVEMGSAIEAVPIGAGLSR